MKPKIIFIHGMFLNPKSWDAWVNFFEGQGYICEAPAWPLHDGEPSNLRSNIPAGLGELNLETLYTHYRGILRGCLKNNFKHLLVCTFRSTSGRSSACPPTPAV